MNSRSSGFSQLGRTPLFLSHPARKAKQDANDVLAPGPKQEPPGPHGGLRLPRGTKKTQWAGTHVHSRRVVSYASPHPFHRRAPGRRPTCWPGISGCNPNPSLPAGLLGTRTEEDFPLRMHQAFVPLWATRWHRNCPGSWSPGTNKRA